MYLNLVIAIIVDAFTGVSSASKLPIDEKLIDRFVKIWQHYDPQATYYIPIEKLDNVLEDLVNSDESKDMFVHKTCATLSQEFRTRLIS